MNASTPAIATLGVVASSLMAADGIRVVTWNITYYDGSRAEQIGTVCYDEWNGRTLDPDIICLQEMTGRVPTLQFVQAMNEADGSPGDWAAAPIYVNPGGGLHTALVYRTSKLEFVASELVSQGGAAPQQPRNVVRFDLRPIGYPEDSSLMSFLPLHFKAGYTDSDLARKLVEAQIVRGHLETLPHDRLVVLGADLNIQRSTDPAYTELMIPLRDPISTPGNWNNNLAFRNIHTQDPTGGGGMDDRLDQILLSPSLLDGVGFDYIGDAQSPWDLSTTEDPDHSYRAWGNDGTSYNQQLRITGNAMVGPVIAQAISDLADPDGHIPVYLDLKVAPRARVVGGDQQLGVVRHGEIRELLIRIGNDADTTLWGTGGIAPLQYSLQYPEFVSGPVGPFEAEPGQQLTPIVLTLNTAMLTEPGSYTESVTLESDDPGAATIPISFGFELIGCSPADLAPPLSSLDFFDVSAFLIAYQSQLPSADLNGDQRWDFFDVSAFLTAFADGCGSP